MVTASAFAEKEKEKKKFGLSIASYNRSPSSQADAFPIVNYFEF